MDRLTAGDTHRTELKGDSPRRKNNLDFAEPNCSHFCGGTLHCATGNKLIMLYVEINGQRNRPLY